MKIAIFAATVPELASLQKKMPQGMASKANHLIQYCITGIGMLQSTFNIQQHIYRHRPDFLLQIGIAGCFSQEVPLGTVIAVHREYLGSLGVNEGHWLDIFDLGLQDGSQPPFLKKALINSQIEEWDWLHKAGIITGDAITVDEITTNESRIEDLKRAYGTAESPGHFPMLESMEGASLHFTGLQYELPYLQIRGVSNYIGQRDKSKWQIPAALQGVTAAALKVIANI